MNREILFRAKRVDNGEWVEGYLMDENYINVPFNDDDVCGRFDDPAEVDPETVCQYTGLKDKNGREIFEGDIAKLILPDGEIRYFKVSIKSVTRKVLCHPDFNDESANVEITGIIFEWRGYELLPCVDTYGAPDYEMMEVVGNAIDNPELLEGI